MKSMVVSVQIQAPVEKVFGLVTDLENLPSRIPDIRKVEVLTPGPFTEGTRFKETRVMFGREATEEMTVTALLPNREFTFVATNCGCRYDLRHTFEPAEGGTRMTLNFGVTALTLYAKVMGKLFFFMKGMMRKKLQKDLDTIKHVAEAA